jgi:hypothetical protein
MTAAYSAAYLASTSVDLTAEWKESIWAAYLVAHLESMTVDLTAAQWVLKMVDPLGDKTAAETADN